MACDRERTAHCPQSVVEAELPHVHSLYDRSGLALAGGHENADGDWQIERSTFFADIGRREVHGDAPRWNLEARIHERSTHTLAALLDCVRRQADNRPLRQPLRGVDLDDDVI